MWFTFRLSRDRLPDQNCGWPAVVTDSLKDTDHCKGVSLADQFETKLYDIVKPRRLCGPVDKNGEGIKISEEPEDHLLCYEAQHARFFVNDQFGPGALETGTRRELCVPSVATF